MAGCLFEDLSSVGFPWISSLRDNRLDSAIPGCFPGDISRDDSPIRNSLERQGLK